jgi:hypothetical protein
MVVFIDVDLKVEEVVVVVVVPSSSSSNRFVKI